MTKLKNLLRCYATGMGIKAHQVLFISLAARCASMCAVFKKAVALAILSFASFKKANQHPTLFLVAQHQHCFCYLPGISTSFLVHHPVLHIVYVAFAKLAIFTETAKYFVGIY